MVSTQQCVETTPCQATAVCVAYAVTMPDATGPAIDPETACLACGSQSRPESMLICDQCQQGFHLYCFGLPSIPEEDEWICQGCRELEGLSVGVHSVLEMAQQMYSGDEPHFTQGLLSGSIVVLGNVQLDLIPPRREAQVLMEDAPISDSLRFYS